MCHSADLGALGNYPGSPFLPSDSEILLDSPEPEDIGNRNCSNVYLFPDVEETVICNYNLIYILS